MTLINLCGKPMIVYKLVLIRLDGIWSYNAGLNNYVGYADSPSGDRVRVPAVQYGIGRVSTPIMEPLKLFALKERYFARGYALSKKNLFGNAIALYEAEAVLSEDQNAWWMDSNIKTWLDVKDETVLCDSIELKARIL